MKLTEAQERILTEAKKDIDTARAYETYEEYEYNRNSYYKVRGMSLEEAKPIITKANEGGRWSKYYEAYREGRTLVIANTRTIKALEKLGLIKIIDEGGKFPDWIEVIGY